MLTKKTGATSSKFNKFSKFIIWIMLLAMVGGTFLSALYYLFLNM
ncbi:MAG: DUF4044 domain-containing protein [Trichococcus flocculiformis]|jgi:hypothetical protein|uniref:DUF4044 domain-containing protein n=1 Tax=Trichococcus flocculiformis TaxID=82803 RepID=A0A143YY91_9LACT|nr:MULTISPECIES: DUF4044 domain-containing protein [Trichococcus]MBP7129071.1 DUF4044 domain-containing protein [Trichococcus sp.]NCU44079.1 DUF4044 domain-containing protein [Candidatus Falkowbacteria bacterium]MBP8682269.1 DUF4044 domain-containing protein [Trichococcus sp.]MBP9594233.1 DUF4044 domain-containing protein [Trichococcus sp.]MBP9976327.1 DUF4044 domain-containing protein [Trichococcus sp.]